MRRRGLLAALLLATTGCASSISSWIVQTRNHQGDVALDHENRRRRLGRLSAARCGSIRTTPHARAGLVAVQARIAQTALHRLAVRGCGARRSTSPTSYAPGDARIEALRCADRAGRDQARHRRLELSRVPRDRRRHPRARSSQLRSEAAEIAATLHRFDYTYDSNELTQAIRQSYELDAQSHAASRDRLIQYRQLVDSGAPENAEHRDHAAGLAAAVALGSPSAGSEMRRARGARNSCQRCLGAGQHLGGIGLVDRPLARCGSSSGKRAASARARRCAPAAGVRPR